MAIKELEIEVKAKMTVDRSTAEGCLKMVEIYLNQNRNISLYNSDREDGTTELKLKDLTEEGQ